MDWSEINSNTILGILTLLIPLGIFYWNRISKRKRISYKIISRVNLAIKEIKENQIQFLYRGNQLEELTMIVIKFINDGKVPISIEDFNESMVLSFGSDSEILTVDVVETNPTGLKVKHISVMDNLTIAPLLINKNEFFLLKIFLTGQINKNIIIKTRIKGITNLNERRPEISGLRKFLLAFNLLCLVVIGVILFIMHSQSEITLSFVLLFSVSAIFLAALKYLNK